jgi:hypothetical protein
MEVHMLLCIYGLYIILGNFNFLLPVQITVEITVEITEDIGATPFN